MIFWFDDGQFDRHLNGRVFNLVHLILYLPNPSLIAKQNMGDFRP